MRPLFEVKGLTKSFGGIVVADDITFSLIPGERVALVGPNGAGKTTFVDMVSGRIRPSAGSVILDGNDITHAKTANRVRKGLVRTFQVTRLFQEMTVIDHVLLAILHREKRPRNVLVDISKSKSIIDEANLCLDTLGMLDEAQLVVREVPYGHQRLLEIAIALSLDPRILFLDEPAAGVPLGEIALIEQAIARLPSEIPVLMIEHDMEFVFRFAKRIIVLAAGKIICDGPPSEIVSSPLVREAYLGSYNKGGADV